MIYEYLYPPSPPKMFLFCLFVFVSFLLRIRVAHSAAMLVRSVLLKSRKSLTRDVFDTFATYLLFMASLTQIAENKMAAFTVFWGDFQASVLANRTINRMKNCTVYACSAQCPFCRNDAQVVKTKVNRQLINQTTPLCLRGLLTD